MSRGLLEITTKTKEFCQQNDKPPYIICTSQNVVVVT